MLHDDKILQKMCINIELAQELKQLDIEQDSLFYWQENIKSCNRGEHYKITNYKDDDSDDGEWKITYYSAFTAGELGQLLPGLIKLNGEYYYIAMTCDLHIFYETMDGENHIYFADEKDNEVNARAKTLIYLIKNNLLPVKDEK